MQIVHIGTEINIFPYVDNLQFLEVVPWLTKTKTSHRNTLLLTKSGCDERNKLFTVVVVKFQIVFLAVI